MRFSERTTTFNQSAANLPNLLFVTYECQVVSALCLLPPTTPLSLTHSLCVYCVRVSKVIKMLV